MIHYVTDENFSVLEADIEEACKRRNRMSASRAYRQRLEQELDLLLRAGSQRERRRGWPQLDGILVLRMQSRPPDGRNRPQLGDGVRACAAKRRRRSDSAPRRQAGSPDEAGVGPCGWPNAFQDRRRAAPEKAERRRRSV